MTKVDGCAGQVWRVNGKSKFSKMFSYHFRPAVNCLQRLAALQRRAHEQHAHVDGVDGEGVIQERHGYKSEEGVDELAGAKNQFRGPKIVSRPK